MTYVRLAALSDAPRISEILADSDSHFDPVAELSRSYAKLWVVAAAESGPADGVLLSWEVADEVQIIDVAVASAARRKGCGRALLHAVIARAQRTSARLLLLEVRRDNFAAQQLYRSCGFAETGERKAYYADGADALLFELRLS